MQPAGKAHTMLQTAIPFLSTHADTQGVDIYRVLFAILFVCFCFVRLRISPPRTKLATSNFAWWLIGVLGRKSDILGHFAPQKAQNQTNRIVCSLAKTRLAHPMEVGRRAWPVATQY